MTTERTDKDESMTERDAVQLRRHEAGEHADRDARIRPWTLAVR